MCNLLPQIWNPFRMEIDCNGLPGAWLIPHMRNTFYIACIHLWGLVGKSSVRSIAFLWVLFDKSCFRAIAFLLGYLTRAVFCQSLFYGGYLTKAVFGQPVFCNRRNLAFSHSHFRIRNWFAVSHPPFLLLDVCHDCYMFTYVPLCVWSYVGSVEHFGCLVGVVFLFLQKQTHRIPTPTFVLIIVDLMP